MLKRDLFLSAMRAQRYTDLDWLVSAFSITKPKTTKVGADKAITPEETVTGRALDITSDMSGYYTLSEDLTPIKIDDAQVGEPLFKFEDTLELKAGEAPNLKSDCVTTYGNALYNWIVLIHTFVDKISFVPTELNVGKVLKIIEPIFRDEPDDETKKEKQFIYVSEYLKFSEAVYFLQNLSQLCTVAFTEKLLGPPDGLDEFKAKLDVEYAGRLEDPVAAAEYEKKLIDFDTEWRKGDASEKFLNTKKSIAIVRKRKYLSFGAEPHPSGDPTKVHFIKTSLHDGLKIDDLPILNNSSRAGSYGRGAQTVFGGVLYKLLVRALSGLSVTEKYCGTKLGLPVVVQKGDIRRLSGAWLMGGEPKLISNDDEAGTYLGKTVMVGSPMTCKAQGYQYCRYCVGEPLWRIYEKLVLAGTAVGQGFLDLFMQMMHGKVFEVAEVDVLNNLH